MTDPGIAETPDVESVFHPSDLSTNSDGAFAHALALALRLRSKLTILHVAEDGAGTWTEFPSVRSTLQRWGVLDGDSPRSAVTELGVAVKKVNVPSTDVVNGVVDYLASHPMDLAVLSTGYRNGRSPWRRQRSLAARMTGRSKVMTLYVPRQGRGFVCKESGEVSLRRVLVPVHRRPDPQAAVDHAYGIGELLGPGALEMTLVHVGKATEMPGVQTPDDPAYRWNVVHRLGDVVGQIVKTARDWPADLIVMTTRGIEGIRGVLTGSVTQQVAERAPCPTLAIPID